MEIPVIYVFTHDSIGLGEDGPTHQPIEQIASFRAMPGVMVFRPCDANEVLEAWKVVMPLKREPVIFALSRQNLPTLDRTKYGSAEGVAKGAYVLADCDGNTGRCLLMATGSEVWKCLQAHDMLLESGVKSRVVSMPCWELFSRQDQAYQDSVLPPNVLARVAVEQAACFGWGQYTGLHGEIVGMSTFGSSAPIKDLMKEFGFEPENIVEAAKRSMDRVKGLGGGA